MGLVQVSALPVTCGQGLRRTLHAPSSGINTRYLCLMVAVRTLCFQMQTPQRSLDQTLENAELTENSKGISGGGGNMNKSLRALRTMRQGQLEQMDEDMQNPALLGHQSQQKWSIQSFVGARKR